MTGDIFCKCDCCALYNKTFLLRPSAKSFRENDIFSLSSTIFAQNYNILRFNSINLINQKYLNGNMQENRCEGEDPTKVPHQYDCECSNCREKHGSLPLLVRVIEGREQSALKSYSNKNKNSENSNLNEPSTSATTVITNQKTMVCPHCDKSFLHRGDFNKHVRKHTGEQPYSCYICKRKFAHTSNLNRHIKVHTGDRPYVCEMCNKTFSRKDKLEMHKKTKLCKKYSEKREQ